MVIVLVGLVVVLEIVRKIYESTTYKKNEKLEKLNLAISIVAAVMLFVALFFGIKTYADQYDIPIHNVQDFRVKMTESYATWDDGYGETYIVPKESVEVKPFPNNEPRICIVTVYEKYDYWDDWACIFLNFRLFGSTKTGKLSESKTYRIECPESQIVISQKSNREVKLQFF